MTIHRASSRASKPAPAANFTGVVWQDEVIVPTAPSRLRASVVTFSPGARTAWHTHPVGQVLHVTLGVGRLTLKGEKPQILLPGDTAWIPPGVLHWHGAAPDRLFAHLAMSESTDKGESTAWFEKVTDAEYGEAPAPAT